MEDLILGVIFIFACGYVGYRLVRSTKAGSCGCDKSDCGKKC